MIFHRCVVGWMGVALALTAAGQVRGGWTFSELGVLPPEDPETMITYSTPAHSASADGSVVVGYNLTYPISRDVWYWWEDGEMTELRSSILDRSTELYVSADASTIVTWRHEPVSGSEHRRVPLRWRDGALTVLGGNYREATARPFDLSADGSVVVGTMGNHTRSMAYRWDNGVMTPLGAVGGAESAATGVSADGSVIVGYTGTLWGDRTEQAFRWEDGVMVGLGTLNATGSQAHDVSADGSVVVGYVHSDETSYEAFRWEDGVMVGLGTLGGSLSIARGVSVDGSVVWGESRNSAGEREPFIWDAEHGMRSLVQILTSDGVDLQEWVLRDIVYVSPALDRIIGNGQIEPINRRAWIATIPEPSTLTTLLSMALAVMAVYLGRRRFA